jgi:hypothetical protein
MGHRVPPSKVFPAKADSSEMPCFFTQFRTQNRFSLLLELLRLFVFRNSGRKTGSHFCWNCFVSLFSAIPDAKPVPTFAGIALANKRRTGRRACRCLEMGWRMADVDSAVARDDCVDGY